MHHFHRRLATLVVASAIAAPLLTAQSGPTAATVAFDTFLAAAATIGTPVPPSRFMWPLPLSSRMTSAFAPFTAAHGVTLLLEPSAGSAEGNVQVSRVVYDERVVDSTALQQRVARLTAHLRERIGAAPTRCMMPVGAPAYLWVPQRVSIRWPRGLAGRATTLAWEASETQSQHVMAYTISIAVGAAGDDATEGFVSCPT